LSWLGHTGRDTRDGQVDNDRQQRRQDRGEQVLAATVLWHLNELTNDPADEVHPGKGRGEGEASDNRVERLGFQFLGDKGHSFDRGVHCKFYIVCKEKLFG
jgi:hypothetical protein